MFNYSMFTHCQSTTEFWSQAYEDTWWAKRENTFNSSLWVKSRSNFFLMEGAGDFCPCLSPTAAQSPVQPSCFCLKSLLIYWSRISVTFQAVRKETKASCSNDGNLSYTGKKTGSSPIHLHCRRQSSKFIYYLLWLAYIPLNPEGLRVVYIE